MSTKSTPIARATKSKFTPQVVAQFITACEIYDAEQDQLPEEKGGRAAEYHDLHMAIHMALGREPWHTNLLSVDPDRIPTANDLKGIRDYAGARALRLALEQAADELERDGDSRISGDQEPDDIRFFAPQVGQAFSNLTQAATTPLDRPTSRLSSLSARIPLLCVGISVRQSVTS
jgi:hypothetical protein